MLDFTIQLWQTALFAASQQPLICLPQSLASLGDRIAAQMGFAPRLLPDSATGFLGELKTVLTTTPPDRLLLIPPLMAHAELPPSLRKAEAAPRNLHDLALAVVLEHAPVDCLVGAWLPLGFFLAGGHGAVHQALLDHHRLRLILAADCTVDRYELPEYAAARAMHTLVFQTGQAGDSGVRLFTCPDIPAHVAVDGSSSPDREREAAVLLDLQKLSEAQIGSTTFGFVLQQPLAVDTVWLPRWHEQKFKKGLQELAAYGELKPLGELFEVFRGFQSSEQVNLLINAAHADRGIAVVEESNILPDNSFNYREVRQRALHKETAPYHLQPNDICLRQSLDSDQRLRAVKIAPEMLPLAAHESLFILRPKADVVVDPDLVTTYLRSGRVTQFLKAQGVAERLYRQSLAEVLIPTADDELKRALGDINAVSATFQGWRDDAGNAVETLFTRRPAAEARRAFVLASRTLRQRERAARQIDDQSYRLRSGLPHPLAYRWRQVETTLVDYESYKNLLETAEVIACYLANLALALTRHLQIELTCVGELAAKLSNSSRGGGTTFGDWVNVLRLFHESKAVKAAGAFPLHELARLLDDEAINDALQRLSNERNDEAHGRGPTGPHVADHFRQARTDLATLVNGLEFLTEYPLRYVVDERRDTLTGLTTYRYQDLMGDHPLVATAQAETATRDIETGSLYLVDRSGDLYLLRPYLTRLQLDDGRWGTFFLDKIDHRAQACQVKCLEHGVSRLVAELLGAFRVVGLVER